MYALARRTGLGSYGSVLPMAHCHPGFDRLIGRHRFHQPDEQAAFLIPIPAQIFSAGFCPGLKVNPRLARRMRYLISGRLHGAFPSPLLTRSAIGPGAVVAGAPTDPTLGTSQRHKRQFAAALFFPSTSLCLAIVHLARRV
jgi:hypothetical protein